MIMSALPAVALLLSHVFCMPGQAAGQLCATMPCACASMCEAVSASRCLWLLSALYLGAAQGSSRALWKL